MRRSPRLLYFGIIRVITSSSTKLCLMLPAGKEVKLDHHTYYREYSLYEFCLCGIGKGCIAWLELTPGSKRANGGSGGRGGDVYIVADKNVRTIIFFGLIFPF